MCVRCDSLRNKDQLFKFTCRPLVVCCRPRPCIPSLPPPLPLISHVHMHTYHMHIHIHTLVCNKYLFHGHVLSHRLYIFIHKLIRGVDLPACHPSHCHPSSAWHMLTTGLQEREKSLGFSLLEPLPLRRIYSNTLSPRLYLEVRSGRLKDENTRRKVHFMFLAWVILTRLRTSDVSIIEDITADAPAGKLSCESSVHLQSSSVQLQRKAQQNMSGLLFLLCGQPMTRLVKKCQLEEHC